VDNIRNEDIRTELGVFSMDGSVGRYIQDWLDHVEEGRVVSRLFGVGRKEEEMLVDHAEGVNS
jgi:hypothetical protein